MTVNQMTIEDTRRMFLYVASRMIEQQDLLSEADRAIGDGDHGVGMARGFEAVQQALEEGAFTSLDGLFNTIGLRLLTSVGGASGAIFGTFFRGGAKRVKGAQSFNAESLALLLQDGLEAVQIRGQAQPGDKTVVDVLASVAPQAAATASLPLDVVLPELVSVAGQAVEDTKRMIAKVGKSKTLGERSLGFPDPGALSMYLIIKSMSEYSLQRSGQPEGKTALT